MATNIFNYDGTKLTTVPDGRLDTTSASIRFPGYGYLNYGEAVNENMLWIMQNFASSNVPSRPVTGQSWYDTSASVLKIYDGSSWTEVGNVLQQSSPPDPPSGQGILWFDTLRKQLHAWSGDEWLLVGPLGAELNNDPINPVIPSNSRLDAALISDGSRTHSVWRLTIGGALLLVISKDAEFVPVPAIPGFASIKPGINFNSTISTAGITGDLSIWRNDQTNVPDADLQHSIGTPEFRLSAVYAESFVGKATSAANADAAIASNSAIISQNSNNLGGIPASIYLRSTANALPDTNNTRDLGSLALQWKTLYASNIMINGSPVMASGISNISGTINQVTVTGTSNLVIGLPQDINISSNPRFSSIGLSSNAGAPGSITFGDGTSQTTAAGTPRTYNLNVLVPDSNINLAPGSKLVLSFTNLVNIPLYTACAEGVYRVILVCTATNTQNTDLQWFPNAVLLPNTITDSFEATDIATSTISGSLSSTPRVEGLIKPGAFWFDTVIGPNEPVGSRGPFMAEFLASTYTVAKMIKASTITALGVSINNGLWLNGTGSGSGSARLNTTTPWTSLGVIRLDPVASVGTLMSGSVTIERLA